MCMGVCMGVVGVRWGVSVLGYVCRCSGMWVGVGVYACVWVCVFVSFVIYLSFPSLPFHPPVLYPILPLVSSYLGRESDITALTWTVTPSLTEYASLSLVRHSAAA